jgi:hypothetical protein
MITGTPLITGSIDVPKSPFTEPVAQLRHMHSARSISGDGSGIVNAHDSQH